MTPKERDARDFMDLSAEEQKELFAGCRAWLELGQKFGSELPLKAMFEITVELCPDLVSLPVEVRGALMATVMNDTSSNFMRVAHDCLMPDCGCKG
ncbi:MAG TPA: hypothetical protein PLD20_05860 [Blastocatellia bacterium]|nr:hypothetical protein [Blastocatellia bacterium]HMV87600.1 hypothetical protein [Blastocatellia bacterium]HMX24706.1 hypothetical protein [Blastocatellia bacterium]HMY73359.1 hypothetical protein [Blastocatellia bacterium]HMZ17433.1 hypothetical protein [Blastocatellia bacterium]